LPTALAYKIRQIITVSEASQNLFNGKLLRQVAHVKLRDARKALFRVHGWTHKSAPASQPPTLAFGSFYITTWIVTPAKIKAAIWNSFTASVTTVW